MEVETGPLRESDLRKWQSPAEREAAVISKGAYPQGLSWGVLFSHSAVSDSLRPRGLQHARLPRSSPSPGACSNSRPSRQ